MTGLETMIQFSKTQADRIAELEKQYDAMVMSFEARLATRGYEIQIKDQQDRIAELEQAIKDADEWLESGEGVSLCYYAFSNANPKSIKIIKEITG